MVGPKEMYEQEIPKPKIMPIPIPIRKEVKYQVEDQMRKATMVANSFFEIISPKYPQSKITDALRDASKGKITDVKVMASVNVYSMEITLSGKPMVLTLRDSKNAFEIMLSDKLGNQIEYIRQQGNSIIKQ